MRVFKLFGLLLVLMATAGLGLTAASAIAPGELRVGTDCQTIQECIDKAVDGKSVRGGLIVLTL